MEKIDSVIGPDGQNYLSIRALAEHFNQKYDFAQSMYRYGKFDGFLYSIGKQIFVQEDAGKKIVSIAVEKKKTRSAKKQIISSAKPSKKTFKTPEGEIIDYSQSRARREMYDSEMARLKLEERKGELVSVLEVKKDAFGLARRISQAILNVPRRISDELAAETDRDKIENFLDKELRQAMVELCQSTP